MKKTTRKRAAAKTAAKKPPVPVPAPKAAPPKPPARVVVSEGPSKADYIALQQQCDDLRERGRAVAAERDAFEAGAVELTEQNKLLSAGVDPLWTDAAVRGAFAATDLEGGPLGACVAVLEAQRIATLIEAEVLTDAGEAEQALAAIGAASRLRKVKQHIADLYHEAKGNAPMDRSIRRASARR